MRFAADPKFKTTFSDEGELTLSSQYVTYTLQTIPANSAEAAAQYREFSDWYAVQRDVDSRFDSAIHSAGGERGAGRASWCRPRCI